MAPPETHRAVHAVFRAESARLIASVARIVRDVGVAEELVQDALIAALEQWPETGIPDNPGAWLMVTAKHLALNALQRGKVRSRTYETMGHEAQRDASPDRAEAALARALEDDVGDDLLRLVFTVAIPCSRPKPASH